MKSTAAVRWVFLAVTTSLVLRASNAHAQQIPVIGADPAQLPFQSVTFDSGGWTFFVHSPLTVTGVGWFDDGRDGLLKAHDIKIWKDTSSLTKWPYIDPYTATPVASATVPSGTGAS